MTVAYELLSTVVIPQESTGKWGFYELNEATVLGTPLAYAFSVTPLDPLGDFWDFLGYYAEAQSVGGVLVSNQVRLLAYLGGANSSNLVRLGDPGWVVPQGVEFQPGVLVNLYENVGASTVRWFAIRDV